MLFFVLVPTASSFGPSSSSSSSLLSCGLCLIACGRERKNKERKEKRRRVRSLSFCQKIPPLLRAEREEYRERHRDVHCFEFWNLLIIGEKRFCALLLIFIWIYSSLSLSACSIVANLVSVVGKPRVVKIVTLPRTNKGVPVLIDRWVLLLSSPLLFLFSLFFLNWTNAG